MTLTTDITDQHFEHKLWENELAFFQDELAIYEHRLEELVNSDPGREALAELEHFQNQFIRQKEVLDHLKHDIKVHEQQLVGQLRDQKSAEPQSDSNHEEIREGMTQFRKIYNDLKSNFFKFMATHK